MNITNNLHQILHATAHLIETVWPNDQPYNPNRTYILPTILVISTNSAKMAVHVARDLSEDARKEMFDHYLPALVLDPEIVGVTFFAEAWVTSHSPTTDLTQVPRPREDPARRNTIQIIHWSPTKPPVYGEIPITPQGTLGPLYIPKSTTLHTTLSHPWQHIHPHTTRETRRDN